MVCQTCRREFDEARFRRCPFCGPVKPGAVSGAIKKSIVMIAAGRKKAVYGSVDEVPDDLRQTLLKSTRGLNSATILIADRHGRERIKRAIRDLPVGAQSRFSRLMPGAVAEEDPLTRSKVWAWTVRVSALTLAGMAAALLWFVATLRG
ncbi:MAG: hypothetical protein IT158_13895 [Bryobacterales bacterium]|nr:hypothetical protein [Bryobacterales bacterium]